MTFVNKTFNFLRISFLLTVFLSCQKSIDDSVLEKKIREVLLKIEQEKKLPYIPSQHAGIKPEEEKALAKNQIVNEDNGNQLFETTEELDPKLLEEKQKMKLKEMERENNRGTPAARGN